MALRRIFWSKLLEYHHRWLVVIVLLLSYGLMVGSAVHKSATVDEQSHLFRGVAFLQKGATHFLLGHPLLASAISAVPLLTEPNLILPVDAPYWADGNWSLAGDAFLWRLNDNPHRLLLLGRLPVMWLTLLLGALVFRWARELGGYRAGLFALVLILLDPNVLAHGRFITGDLPVTLFFAVAVYGYWRWTGWRGRMVGNILLTGVGLGLAGATKFNAALLLPMLGVLGLILAWRRRTLRPLTALVAAGLVGWLVIWVVYGFEIRPLPGGAFWDDLFWELQYFGKPHGAYFAGNYSTEGWWYYFIVAFFLKTPLPTLVLLISALIVGFQSSRSRGQSYKLFLLWPPAIYFAFSLTSSLNIGYRYLLPMLPFLFVFTAVALVNGRAKSHRFINWAVLLLVGGLIVRSLAAFPNFTPYFNVLVGDNGWRILSDSNVDWGQDLPALADWQEAHNKPVKLSYFGTAHPSAYGIEYSPLPTWAPGPEQGNPALQSYNPVDPAPGLYAISVTSLHGVVLGEGRDSYAWFREREPLIQIGGSIFVYDVPSRGPKVDLMLSQLLPAQLAPELHAQLATNDVRVRWFDATTSFIWPEAGGWLTVPADMTPDDALSAFWPETAVLTYANQQLYPLPSPPELDWFGTAQAQGSEIAFLGHRPIKIGDGSVSLLTAWRVNEETERPLQLFVHALDENGQNIGQWDGLDVEPTRWQSGDLFIQLHHFTFPQNQTPHDMLVGVYDAETLERLAAPLQLTVSEY